MKRIRKQIAIFTDTYPLLGPIVWILTVQFFIVQFIVAAAWPAGYSWSRYLISDLGNTTCGEYLGRYVCSPHFLLMNASLMWLGLFMALGSFLIYQEFHESRASLLAFSLMTLAGLGTFIVGFVPEDVSFWIHSLGGFVSFVLTAVSLLILTYSLPRVRLSFRIYTFLTGVVSFVAFILFATHTYLNLGMGGMERFITYPQILWLVLFGIYMSASHYRERKIKSRFKSSR